MGEIQCLFQLQDIELRMEQLQKTLRALPVFAEFKQMQSESGDAKEALGWAQAKLNEHSKRLKRLEVDLKKMEKEQQSVQSDLYADRGQSVKELEKLDDIAKSLKDERVGKEENLLIAMEGKEDLEKSFSQAQDSYTTIRKELIDLQQTGNKEIHKLRDEIAALRKKRELLLKKISEPLITEYNLRRDQYHGKPLSQLENNICTGCRICVSSITRINLQQGKTSTVYCENCGRLLVPTVK